MPKNWPIATFLLSFLTLATSISLAVYLHGYPWSTVPVIELRHYGGLELRSFSMGEAWRLMTAQLVHVKQAHMIFNVVSFYVLGSLIERIAGAPSVFLIWLIGGVSGLVASAYFAPYPYDIGTGASQAIMSIAAANLVAIYRHYSYSTWQKYALAAIIGTSMLLDVVAIHYPKPGHVVGFVVGLCLGYYLVPRQSDTYSVAA